MHVGHEADEAHPVVSMYNTHILVDATDPSSDPQEGWMEVSEEQFVVFTEERTAWLDLQHQANVAAETKAKQAAYDEAISLGFSPSAASTMSGYTPGD